MGEILFRGKRKDNGEWVEGNLFISDTDGKNYILLGSRRVTIEYEVVPSTVGQYTGLPDKNVGNIFEGDVIRADETTDYALGVVKYGLYYESYFSNEIMHIGFYVDWIEKVNNHFLRHDLGYWFPKCEIIGNIYDNPELLEDAP